MIIKRFVLACVLSALSPMVSAAGLSLPSFAEYSQLNNPWYVSGFGGLGIMINKDYPLSLSLTGAPANPYSVVINVDHRLEYHGGAALGYRITKNWRVEAQYTFMQSDSSDTTGIIPISPVVVSTFFGNANLTAHGFLFNVIYDFDPLSAHFEPYVGVGVGAVLLRGEVVGRFSGVATFPPTLFANKRSDTQVAGQVMVGFRYNIADRYFVDFGYRYLETSKPNFYTDHVQNNMFSLTYTIVLTGEHT